MKIKGKKKLEKKISKLLKKFGVKAIVGDSFEYEFLTESVIFSVFESPEIGKSHRRWIKKHFGTSMNETDYFLFSLLHEVGHHFTLDDLTEEENTEEMLIRNFLMFSSAKDEEINEAYYNLPAELLATEWALTFMHKNPKWCIKTQKKIAEAMLHFFKANGWE